MSFNDKPRKPLPRRTPLNRGTSQLKRTGFARKVYVPGESKPKSGFKPKRLVRSPEWTAYKLANGKCELIGKFPPGHEVFNAPDWLWQKKYDEIHHIMHGQAGRIDIPTNMIRICKPVHNWIHFAGGGNANDGRALCLIRKAEKNELDWKALRDISGKEMPGWLLTDSHKLKQAWIDRQWQQLIA